MAELYNQILAEIAALDPSEPGCAIKIGVLRREMDVLCDQNLLSVKQWRLLLNEISTLRLAVQNARPLHELSRTAR